jgi:hypothetical protein
MNGASSSVAMTGHTQSPDWRAGSQLTEHENHLVAICHSNCRLDNFLFLPVSFGRCDMSQRGSGYKRIPGDAYYTPEWVASCLKPHIPCRIRNIFEPAAGDGAIIRALDDHINITGQDLTDGYDYLQDPTYREGVITNPPFGRAEEFLAHALATSSWSAMLLRCDYDHAVTRSYLFRDNPWFSQKIELTKRIVWTNLARPGAAPSFNHAWFIFDKEHDGPPTIAYAP